MIKAHATNELKKLLARDINHQRQNLRPSKSREILAAFDEFVCTNRDSSAVSEVDLWLSESSGRLHEILDIFGSKDHKHAISSAKGIMCLCCSSRSTCLSGDADRNRSTSGTVAVSSYAIHSLSTHFKSKG